MEQAEAAQIPRNYPFPDEEEVQLVDTVIKLLAEVDPQPDAAGAAAAGTSTQRSMQCDFSSFFPFLFSLKFLKKRALDHSLGCRVCFSNLHADECDFDGPCDTLTMKELAPVRVQVWVQSCL